MEKKLLILGILKSHELHGYQLNEVLNTYPGIPVSLKKSNIYKILSDLENDGLAIHKNKQSGNRPQKRVYSITKAGEKELEALLTENLSSYPSPDFPSVVGLDLLTLLPTEKALGLLEKRLTLIKENYKKYDELDSDMRHQHISLDYYHNFYQFELEWTENLIKHLRNPKSNK